MGDSGSFVTRKPVPEWVTAHESCIFELSVQLVGGLADWRAPSPGQLLHCV